MGVIIDTCIRIDVERGVSHRRMWQRILKKPVYISPVTIPELMFGVKMAVDRNIKKKKLPH